MHELGSKEPRKIGLYIRVSTEEQAACPDGSIRNQEDRLREQAKRSGFGEVSGVYIDRALSGKNMARPELRRLLADVAEKKITCVMVSELSRLSRSIKDFIHIWDHMKEVGCWFISLRETFDTSTAAGEMMLLSIANFSQFERKQTAERISANFLARAKRGLTNGGTIPLGYRKHPEKSGHLVVDEETRDLVRTCFETYLKAENLCGAAKLLNEQGLRLPKVRKGQGGTPKDGRFTMKNLQTILRNKSYIGLRRFRDGREEKVVQGCWTPIVEAEVFEAVQKILDRNKTKHLKIVKNATLYPYFLSSVVYCGQCGEKMIGKSAHGRSRKIAYYEHGQHLLRSADKNKCIPYRVQAEVLEPVVWDKVTELIKSPGLAKKLFESLKEVKPEEGQEKIVLSLHAQLSLLKRKQAALSEHLSNLPADLHAGPIYEHLRVLQGRVEETEESLQEALRKKEVSAKPAAFVDYVSFLEKVRELLRGKVESDIKAKIVRLLISQVKVQPSGVDIFFNLSEQLPKQVRDLHEKTPRDISRSAQPTNIDFGHKKTTDQKLVVGGSHCLTFGGGGGNRTRVRMRDNQDATCLAT